MAWSSTAFVVRPRIGRSCHGAQLRLRAGVLRPHYVHERVDVDMIARAERPQLLEEHLGEKRRAEYVGQPGRAFYSVIPCAPGHSSRAGRATFRLNCAIDAK